MTKILVVDDDPQLRQSFERILMADGHTVTVAATGEAGVASVRNYPPDLVIMDVRMPGMSGLEAFREIQKIDSKLPVLIMTAYGTTETAIEATKMGAFDYVLKPFEIPDILDLIAQALRAGHFMRSQVEMDTTPETTAPDAIIGRSDQMQAVYKAIGRVAAKDATVLVRGESGTGKELAARALYQHSLRAQKPFLIINCVAIPETLLESELFGYEKGAFTGAVSQRVGKIEQANGGTVFLDEIGDMPYNIQAKILRLLQEKSIERLGRPAADSGGCADHCSHQSKPRRGGRRRSVSGGFVLPAQCCDDPDAATAGAQGGYPVVDGLFSGKVLTRNRHSKPRDDR